MPRSRRPARTAALTALAGLGLFALAASPAHAAATISGSSQPQHLFAESALSVFDLDGFESPAGSVVSPDGSRLYVASAADDRVVIFDTATGDIVGGFDTGDSPRGLTITPDGSTVYVANRFDGDVTVAVNGVVTGTIDGGFLPFAVAVSSDESTLYIARPGGIEVRATSGGALIDDIAMGLVGVRGLALTPDGSKLYAFRILEDDVVVIDTADNTIDTVIPLGDTPTGIAITDDGATVWVSVLSGDLVPIDTAADTTGTPLPTGNYPLELQVSPDGAWIYALLANGNLGVVDVSSGDVDEYSVGDGPYWLSISPDGSRLYVNNWNDDTVSVFDMVTLGFSGVGEIQQGTASTSFDVMFGDGSDPLRQPVGAVTVQLLDDTDTVVATSIVHNPGAADGTLAVQVPTASLPAGSYTVRASWQALDQTVVAEAEGFLVIAVLPATGAETSLVLGGGVLLLVVGAALVTARRAARR